ncbi:MAG: PDZ domain-containing protein [Halioglobus sp.]
MNRMTKLAICLLAMAMATVSWADHHGGENAKKAMARAWIEAGNTGKAEFIAFVEKNMADDGISIPARYVGFGFQLDPNNDDDMTVVAVTDGTPASKVLKVGDVFVSVAGVPATPENSDRMSFRGKPGEPVKAMINRGGKEMAIEVKRGVIEVRNSKDKFLANLALADADNWTVDKSEIVEITNEGDVVWAVQEITDTELDTGIVFVSRNIMRFEINDAGKITWAANRGESRFVLEQLGYTISR